MGGFYFGTTPEVSPTVVESYFMPTVNRMSVILPVRDGEDRIIPRIQQVLSMMDTMISDPEGGEVVVVDDGSRDNTATVLDDFQVQQPRVRIVRHSRPRGMEAAGQTGLERATGDLVFIQESDVDVRIEDMQRLYRMSQDHSIVAARAVSTPRSLSAELLRRLRAWGAATEKQMLSGDQVGQRASLQMIRRPHLQNLANPHSAPVELEAETIHTTTIEAK